MNPPALSREAGLTLVEVMIAVALFALIGVAGFALVQTVIGVQRRTDERLERLADLQRAMHIVTSDFEQAEGGTVSFDGAFVSFQRSPSGPQGGNISITYGLRDGGFHRTIAGAGAPRDQILIAGLSELRWQFFLSGSGWQDSPDMPGQDKAVPLAVSFDATLNEDTEPGGTLRRVVTLPLRARK